MGVMDSSAPIEKKIIPIMTRNAPVMNLAIMSVDKGAMVKPRSRTISTIGTTALTASLVLAPAFSFNIDF